MVEVSDFVLKELDVVGRRQSPSSDQDRPSWLYARVSHDLTAHLLLLPLRLGVLAWWAHDEEP